MSDYLEPDVTGITAKDLKRRRARARSLRKDGLTQTEIAKRLGVAQCTVSDYLRADAPPKVSQLPSGTPVAGPGNELTMRHGAYSERAIRPIRERHVDELSGRYPFVSPVRIRVQAQRLAMIDLVADFLDVKGVVRVDLARTFDVADKLMQWLAVPSAGLSAPMPRRRPVTRPLMTAMTVCRARRGGNGAP